MVERRVEDRRLTVGGPLQPDARELPLPGLPGLLPQLVEGAPGRLGLEVPPGAFGPDERDADLHADPLAGFQVAVLDITDRVVRIVRLAETVEGPGEAGVEVDGARPGNPFAHTLEADDRHRVDHRDGDSLHPLHQVMARVDHDPPDPASAERISVHPDAGRGRQFDKDILVAQQNGIVSRGSPLRVVREARTVAPVGILVRPGAQLQLSAGGHEEDVPKSGEPGPADVRMGKPLDHIVVVMVSGTPFPRGEVVAGAELHHAERRGRPGIGMPLAARPDHGIDPFDGTLGGTIPSQQEGKQD